jgi:hypothetical protein
MKPLSVASSEASDSSWLGNSIEVNNSLWECGWWILSQ